MHTETDRTQELLPLTDSLASRIRWRFCDYEAMVRAEVALLLRTREEDGIQPRSARIGRHPQ